MKLLLIYGVYIKQSFLLKFWEYAKPVKVVRENEEFVESHQDRPQPHPDPSLLPLRPSVQIPFESTSLISIPSSSARIGKDRPGLAPLSFALTESSR
jgi:hypothetical protein